MNTSNNYSDKVDKNYARLAEISEILNISIEEARILSDEVYKTSLDVGLISIEKKSLSEAIK